MGAVWGPSLSGDGSLLSAAWPDEGMVARVSTCGPGDLIREIRPDGGAWSTALSPDGTSVAIGGLENAHRSWWWTWPPVGSYRLGGFDWPRRVPGLVEPRWPLDRRDR